MVSSPGDLPDWTKGFLLIGRDGSGDPVVVLVDDNGQMQVLLRGADASGDPQTVKVDADGQLYTVLRGADGVDVAVDASGFLTAALKGIDGGSALRTILVDTSGRLVMVPYGTTTIAGTATVTQTDSVRETQGANGETLITMAVDGAGRLIMVPYGTTTVAGTATVTQDDSVREIQGADGATLRTIVVDANGQMVMVPRGQSGYYMAVDADGYLTAVLKGNEGGTLTTIKVDTEGRLESYGLDSEDQWGQVLRVGNAELAARLGSVVGWDRRGSVAWQTDFGLGLGSGLKYPTGTGSSITLVPDYWLTGGYSVKLVGGSDGNHKAYIDFLVEASPSLDLGLEITFSYPAVAEFIKAELRVYTAGRVYIAAVRHNLSTNYVQYLNSSGSWTNIANPTYLTGAEMFHRLKVVADFANLLYKRVLYAGTEVDLSAQGVYNSASGYSAAMYVEVELNSRSGYNDVAYLDSIVLTTGEPD